MLHFSIQNRFQDRTSNVSEAAGARWRFHGRIMVGLSSNRLYIGGSNSGTFRWNLELRILWQAQYLVSLKGDFTCSAHWKWRFICDADQSRDSFCMAGAVFGEFEGWLLLLRALEMTFHMWRGSIMRFILRGRRSNWWVWRVTLLAPRIGNDVSYVTRITDGIHFAWQAQYLVKLEGDSCCSAHCKWRFTGEADQSWDSFCMAGAVFGEVGVWLYLLRAV